jgi:hypothetical protein
MNLFFWGQEVRIDKELARLYERGFMSKRCMSLGYEWGVMNKAH